MLEEFLIQNSDFTNRDIASLSDTPSADGMTADALKNRFDASTKHIVMPKFNAVIEALSGNDGALNIGATEIEGLAGITVQDILLSLKTLVDTKSDYTLTEAEIGTKFDTAEAQGLIKSIAFDDQTGIFTITQYDDTVHTIDTALEKVALNVRLDGQQFVLTLVDGTEQRVDLSEFLTQYEFTDSNTIAFSVVNGFVNANIKPRSIGNAMLDEEVYGFVVEQNTEAKASADASAMSATSARTSETNARASYLSALQCQDNACTCATNASLSEENALASANSASQSAQLARQAADEAQAVVGDGVMLVPVYDTKNRKTDIFDYVDESVAELQGEVDKATVKHLLSFDGTNISDGDTVLTFDAIHAMLMDTPAFVVLVYNDKAYHPNVVSTSAIVFSSTTVSDGNLRVDRITLSSNNTVTTTYGIAEKEINKVSVINDTNKSDTNKYPSNKAIVDYVDTEIVTLKNSVSDGKTLVASAITNKRVPTSATDTFQTMADNINSIVLGSGNATVDKVLAPYTFTNDSGIEQTGTIPSKAAATITPTTSNQTIAAGQYLKGNQTIAGSSNLVASNIKSGVNIFGVVGSLQEFNVSGVVACKNGTTTPPSKPRIIIMGTITPYDSGYKSTLLWFVDLGVYAYFGSYYVYSVGENEVKGVKGVTSSETIIGGYDSYNTCGAKLLSTSQMVFRKGDYTQIINLYGNAIVSSGDFNGQFYAIY